MFHEELTSESLLVTNQMQAGDCQVKTINPLLMRGRRSSVVMLQTESPTTPRGGKRKEEGQPKMNDSGQDVEAPRLWIDGSDRSFLDELLVREPIEDDSAESQSERQAPAQKKEEEKAVRSVERFVKAGTGRGLAMCMVELYWMDWHYVRCFLACFREFLSADQLLGVLAERFMRARAAGGLSEGWQLQVRSRVVEVLELWIAQYAASDLQDGSRGALGAAISFLRAAEALRIDKYAISARAGHLHALCVGMAISTTRLGAARPVLAHAQTLSMMAHVLIDRAQQQRQDEDKDKEVARESHDLGQISEWVENVLACGTQQALHWILALLDHGFLRVAASTPPPSPPSPSLSPSPQQKQSCGSKHRPPNQSGKRLLPISPSKSHKSKCGKSAAAGDINPYAQSALEDAEGEESMMAEHLAVPTRHPISNKHQIPCSSSSSSSSSNSNSPCSRSTKALGSSPLFRRRGSVTQTMFADVDIVDTSSSSSSPAPLFDSSDQIATLIADWQPSSSSSSISTPLKSSSSSSSSSLTGETTLLKTKFKLVADPERKAPVAVSLLGVDAEGFAEELARLDRRVFCGIGLRELGRLAWTTREAAMRTPNLFLLTTNFNCLCFWIATEVLSQKSPADRARALGAALKIGEGLRRRGDMQSLMAVIGGLQFNVVGRLKQSWALLSPKRAALYAELCRLCSPARNYKACRDYLSQNRSESENQELEKEKEKGRREERGEDGEEEEEEEEVRKRVIPWVGLFTRDVVWAHEGNEDGERAAGEGGERGERLYAVAKVMVIGRIVRDIQAHQQLLASSPLPSRRRQRRHSISSAKNVVLPVSLSSALPFCSSEDALYALSLSLEPPLNPMQ